MEGICSSEHLGDLKVVPAPKCNPHQGDPSQRDLGKIDVCFEHLQQLLVAFSSPIPLLILLFDNSENVFETCTYISKCVPISGYGSQN